MNTTLRFIAHHLVVRVFVATLLLFGMTVSVKAQDDTKEHQLVAGDTVEVRVFQEAELDSKATLSKDGKVSLSLIGEVSVEGMSSSEAARAIEARYKQGYLAKPKVTVSVTGYAKRRFTILGAVNKPGSFYFPEGDSLSILQAIGMAGGYSKVANASKISVKRGNEAKAIQVDAKKMAKENNAKPFYIHPGDIITVGESIF